MAHNAACRLDLPDIGGAYRKVPPVAQVTPGRPAVLVHGRESPDSFKLCFRTAETLVLEKDPEDVRLVGTGLDPLLNSVGENPRRRAGERRGDHSGREHERQNERQQTETRSTGHVRVSGWQKGWRLVWLLYEIAASHGDSENPGRKARARSGATSSG
jgi:hypothetical protein